MASCNERGIAKLAQILMSNPGVTSNGPALFNLIGGEMGSLIVEVEELKKKLQRVTDKYAKLKAKRTGRFQLWEMN